MLWKVLFDANDDGGASGGAGGSGQAAGSGGSNFKDFAAFLESQPDEIKTLYAADITGLKSTVDNLRNQVKENSVKASRLKELEDEKKAREDAAKTELEKLQEQVTALTTANAQLKTQRTTDLIKSEVQLKAAAAGFADPTDVYVLMNLSTVAVGDDGKVSGIEPLLDELKKAKPYLLKAQSDGVGNGGRPKEKDGKTPKIAPPSVSF